MMKLRVFACVAMFACSGVSHAEPTPIHPVHASVRKAVPNRRNMDARFQTIRYTGDVIRLQAKAGRLLEIEFGKDETKIEFGIGDREAWNIKIEGNVMFIKPKALLGDTNLRVVTNRRKYWFDLAMSNKRQGLTYHVDFQYPPESLSPSAQTMSPGALIDTRLSGAMNAVVAKAGPAAVNGHALNGDYGFIGPDELLPIAVFDNGEMTFIEFAPNNPMPVVFAKEEDGSEARVNFHVEKDIFVVHRTARHLMIRRGAAAACLINGSFRANGANTTYTASAGVQRVIKGEGANVP